MNTLCQQVPFIDLAAQHASLAQEINQAISRVLESTAFILGRDVMLFEEEFAAFCGTKFAVGVDSGTSALELALRAFGVGPGDEVITAANTFIATVLAISYTGATPVLIDIDPCTYTISIRELQQAITNRTKAIIPVHLYGHPADMDAILTLARQHDLIVLEDACQAHGARYKEKRVGSLGHAAAFSFYPAKNLGCCGDGGMLVTDDQQIAEEVRILRNYGQREKYHHVTLGYNRRLDSIQAAVLRVKLQHLDDWNRMRREHAQLYTQLLSNNGILLPVEANFAEAVWHLYVIRVSHRDTLRDYLAEQGIGTGIHYPIPVHAQPAYQSLGYPKSAFPIATRNASHVLSLPMYAELTPDMIGYVAKMIKHFVSEYKEELVHPGIDR